MNHQESIKELFHVAGDVPDPAGGDLRGVSPGYDFERGRYGRPFVLWQFGDHEVVLELDVYHVEGEPMQMIVICPMCIAAGRDNQGLTIRQDAKPFLYERDVEPPVWPGWSRERMRAEYQRVTGSKSVGYGGRLSVEPFACTWEATPELQRDFGLARCPWRVAIDNNVARNIT